MKSYYFGCIEDKFCYHSSKRGSKNIDATEDVAVQFDTRHLLRSTKWEASSKNIKVRNVCVCVCAYVCIYIYIYIFIYLFIYLFMTVKFTLDQAMKTRGMGEGVEA